MTPSEMLTLLGYRLEDPNGDVYDNTLKILMINRAQNRVYTELNPHVVPELQSVESNLALDETGAFDSSALSNTVLGGISGGVYDVKDATDNNFTRKLSFDEYKAYINRDYTYSTDNPHRYILGTKQYYLPFTATLLENTDAFASGSYYYIKTFQAGDDFVNVGGANASGTRFLCTTSADATTFTTSVVYLVHGVNVYYKKQPTQITVANYATQSFTVENENVHDAIAFYAESLLWGVNNDPRKGDALQEASSLIETLNTTITATDSNSIDDKEYLDYDSEYSLPLSSWEI